MGFSLGSRCSGPSVPELLVGPGSIANPPCPSLPALQVHGALLSRQRCGPGADEQLLHRAGHPHQLQHLLLRLLRLRREHGQALGEEPLLRHRRRVAGAADAVSGAGEGTTFPLLPGKPWAPAPGKQEISQKGNPGRSSQEGVAGKQLQGNPEGQGCCCGGAGTSCAPHRAVPRLSPGSPLAVLSPGSPVRLKVQP